MPSSKNHTIKLYSRTKHAWKTMYEDCKNAESSIIFEQYIFKDDEEGRKFLELFTEKARQGIRVQLLFDKVGAKEVYKSPLVKTLEEQGGSVTFYNNIGWHNIVFPWTWFPRNHLKKVIIDNEIVHVGGACVASYMADWYDVFIRLPLPALSKHDIEYVTSHPKKEKNDIYEELLHRISQAKSKIILVTPYLIPPKKLLNTLELAINRGVDIQIIISEKTDVPVAKWTSYSYISKLLKSGIQVYLYQNTVCHAKYTIIDNEWAMLGSANLDYLSLCRNREGNIMTTNQTVVEKIEKVHSEHSQYTRKATIHDWKNQPISLKLTGLFGRLIKRFL